MGKPYKAVLTDKPIDLQEASAFLEGESGAIVIFEGVARGESGGRMVKYLVFESYEKMAANQLESILKKASQKRNINRAFIIHRLGRVEIGDIIVLIGVSSMHRGEAFEICRFLIDTLKEEVPIWKKEVFDDGSEWVSPHP